MDGFGTAVLGVDRGLAPAGMDGDAVALALGAVLFAHGHFVVPLQAIERHALRAAAHGGAGDIGGDVAAADHNDLAGELRFGRKVDLLCKVHAGHDALGVVAGNAETSAVLQTDGNIEPFVALRAQLGDGDVPADIHTAAEFHAHLAQNVDLGLHNVLFETEVRNGVHQHAAETGRFVEHGRTVALLGEEVRAGHTRRPRADDGDLLIESALDLRDDLFGDKARGGFEILLGNEALDLIDGDGLIDGAAGAGVLAAAVADAAAYGGEWVFALDELERFAVLALRGELQIALHGDVRRARRLARGRAGIVAVDAVVVAVVDVPLIRAPGGLVRQLVARVLDGAVLRAELLAELHRARGTRFNTAAARNAVFALDLRNVGAAGEVWRVEKLARAQRVADVHVAVADGDDLLFAVDVRDLMDKAVLLGLVQDLEHLVIGDVMAAVGLDDVARHIAHGDAPVLRIVAAALAELGAGHTAGAGRSGVNAVVLFQPVGDVLDGDGLVLGLDRLFHGDNMHADAGASGRHHRRDLLQREERHALKERRDLRMLVDLRLTHVDELRAARNELRQRPALLVVRVFPVQIFPVVLDKADVRHLGEQLFELFLAFAGERGDLRGRFRLAHLHLERDIRHFVRNNARESPILGIVARDLADAVGDHRAELEDLLSRLVRAGDRKGIFAFIHRHSGLGLLIHADSSTFYISFV